MGKPKKPAFAQAPPSHGKQPRLGVHDPGLEALRKPSWRLQYLDLEGPFGWRKCADAHLEPILNGLQSFETMNWTDIEQRKSCHSMPVPALCKEARERLGELKLDDVDVLYQLRLSGTQRVWGIRDRNILKLLWWDPDHDVYPVEKKHT